jgi:hypothetical protein
MTVADNVTLPVHLLPSRSYHLRVELLVHVRQADVIEHNLQVSLTNEMSWLLVRFEMST